MTVDRLSERIAILEERVAGMIKAVELQLIETLRRLTELNHAHEKQVRDQQTYVANAVYEGFVREMREWREKVDKTLNELQGRSGGTSSARALFFQILPLIISLIALLALFWKANP